MAMGNHVSAFQSGRVSVSNRQYSMLRTISGARGSVVRIEEIMGWSQITMGSLKERAFISETVDKHGIKLTPLGKQALNSYLTAEFYRKHESLHFAGNLNLEPPANLLASVMKMAPAVSKKAANHAHAA